MKQASAQTASARLCSSCQVLKSAFCALFLDFVENRPVVRGLLFLLLLSYREKRKTAQIVVGIQTVLVNVWLIAGELVSFLLDGSQVLPVVLLPRFVLFFGVEVELGAACVVSVHYLVGVKFRIGTNLGVNAVSGVGVDHGCVGDECVSWTHTLTCSLAEA